MEAIANSLTNLNPVKNWLRTIGNKLYDLEHIPTRHRVMLEKRYGQIKLQLLMMRRLLLVWLFVLTCGLIWPDFFQYPYLGGGWPSASVLLSFWPLLLWGLFLISTNGKYWRSSQHDEELLLTGLITGNLAAIWEEVAFRYLYIFFAILSLSFSNWLLQTWFAAVLVLISAFGTLAIFTDDKHSLISGLKSLLLLIMLLLIWGKPDPWFYAYQNLIMPVINTLSFGAFTPIFNNQELHHPMVVMGAILANNWFRDGHKYQGWVGWLDSWMMGFVLIFACFTYGLLTAIVIHGLWNSLVFASRYFHRKRNG